MSSVLTYSLLTALASEVNEGPGPRSSHGIVESPEVLAEERALIERVRGGDAEAFGVLMTRYFAHAVRLAAHFVHDRAEAEDVAQDVFARLWAGREAWRPTTSVRAYVLGAVRHRALNVLKHQGVEARYAVSMGAAADDRDDRAEANPAHRLDRAVELAALHRAVDELPERRRAALTLRYAMGLSHAEVGEALGVSPKAAKELLARTLEALHARLSTLL